MDLRDCQNAAIACARERRAANESETNLSLCTGAGKSIIMRELTSNSERIILIFPWLDLMNQYYSSHKDAYKSRACVRYLATEGSLPDIQRISETMSELDETSYVIFTTYTSAPDIFANLTPRRSVNLLVHDEAHRTERPEYKASFQRVTEYIQHTVNLSATLPETKVPHYKYPLLRGIKDGVVRDFHMELFLCVAKERSETQLIIKIVEKLLMLHSQVKLLIYTAEANTFGADSSSVKTFMDKHSETLKSLGYWIEGINEDTKDRQGLLRKFEEQRDVSILVSCKTLSEGIDLKNANCMLPWDPSSSVKENIQRIGRVLRLYKNPNGSLKKEQQASTVLIPVFLEEQKYTACNGDKEAINALLCKEISEGERGNFRPIVSVCTALKDELAQEDEELFNRLLNYPYEPKVAVNRNLVECVAKQCKKSTETVLEDVVKALEGKVDEEQLELIMEGEWDEEVIGEVAQALADTQGLTLVVRDGDEADMFGSGETPLTVEKKANEEGYKVVKGKRAEADKEEADKEEAKKRIAQRLHVDFSDGCKVLLDLDSVEGTDATGDIVLSRLTTEVKYDEDWEKRRLEWVAMYEKLGRCPSSISKDINEKRAGRWQSHQRENYKKVKYMSLERIDILNKTLGWKWEEVDMWEDNRLHWISVCQVLGRLPRYGSTNSDEKRANNWQKTQRDYYNRNLMSEERKQILSDETLTPGWKWNKEDAWEKARLNWIDQYNKLGHSPAQSSKDPDERRASIWQCRQRKNNKDGTLTQKRREILNNKELTPGWKWQEDDTWELNRQKWIEQYTKLGRKPSGNSKDVDEQFAGQWQQTQRGYYNTKNKCLTLERIKILNLTPGWKWEEEDTWEDQRQNWIKQHHKLGHNPSPFSDDPDEKRAGQWQAQQRNNYSKKNGRLSAERISILNLTSGWKWEKDKWEIKRLKWIEEFQKKGSSPSGTSKNENERHAGQWQSQQRKNYMQKKSVQMTPERIKILNETPGWTWSADEPPQTPYIQPTNELVQLPTPTETPRVRQPLKKLKKLNPEISGEQRQLSQLEEYHQRFKKMNASTYKSSVKAEEFTEYHQIADTYDAKDPPERQPINKIAGFLAKYNKPSYKAIDLGCGKNRLRVHEAVSRMSWTSVDVHAVDDTVTVADMSALPFEDETYDIAVLSRSLWARNHMDVLKEVYRILKCGGRVVICESFRRWLNLEEEIPVNTLVEDLKTAGFDVIYEEGTSHDDTVDNVFQYIIVTKC